jgi:hypothetical protein
VCAQSQIQVETRGEGRHSVDTKPRPPGRKAVGLTAAEICVGTAKIHAHGLIEQSKKRNSTEQEVQSSIEDSK